MSEQRFFSLDEAVGREDAARPDGGRSFSVSEAVGPRTGLRNVTGEQIPGEKPRSTTPEDIEDDELFAGITIPEGKPANSAEVAREPDSAPRTFSLSEALGRSETPLGPRTELAQVIAAADQRKFDEQTFVERNVTNPLKRGVSNLGIAAGAGGANVSAEKLQILDEIDTMLRTGDEQGALKRALQLQDPEISEFARTPNPVRRKEIRDRITGALTVNIGGIVESQQEAAAIPRDPKLSAALESGSLSDLASAIIDDPAILLRVTLESAPLFAPGMVAAPFVGPVAAFGGTSLLVENGLALVDALQKAGVDVNNPDALRQAFENPEVMRVARDLAIRKGAPVALFDAISGGIAGKLLGPRSIAGRPLSRPAQELANIPPQVLAQGTLGGAGEAGGQLLRGDDKINLAEVGLEAVAEVGGVAFETPSAALATGRLALGTEDAAGPRIRDTERVEPSVAPPGTFSLDEAVGLAEPTIDVPPVTAPPAETAPEVAEAPAPEVAEAVTEPVVEPVTEPEPEPERPSTRGQLAEMLEDERSADEIRAERQAAEEAAQVARESVPDVGAEVSVAAEGLEQPITGAIESVDEIEVAGQPSQTVVQVRSGEDVFEFTAGDVEFSPVAAVEPEIAPEPEAEAQPIVDEAQQEPVVGTGEADAPVQAEVAEHVEVAAEQVEPEPSPAQKEAGNYKKGHLKLHGFDIAIENPKGSNRTGTDSDGEVWSVQMPAHYGYIKRTEGADGDQVDVYIGDNPESDRVFVVDQMDPATGKFDEHKAILGVTDVREAQALYKAGFSDGSGPSRIGALTEQSVEEFREFVANGNLKRPLVATERETPAAPPVASQGERAALAAPAEIRASQPGAAPGRRPSSAPQNLLQLLATRGLRDNEGHSLVKGRNARRFIPGKGALIRPNGMGIDEAGELLHQEGFFGSPDTSPRPTEADVLELLDRALAGEKIFSEFDIGEVQRREDETRAKDERRQLREAKGQVAKIAGEFNETLTKEEIDGLAETMLTDGLSADDVVGDIAERRAIEYESELADASGEAQTAAQEQEADASEARETGADRAHQGKPQEAAEPGAAREGPARVETPAEDGTAPGPEASPAEPVATEQTPEGEQILTPVTRPVSDRDRLAAQADRPLQGERAQRPADEGLFDVAGRGQLDLVEQARKAERAPPAEPAEPTPQKPAQEAGSSSEGEKFARRRGTISTGPDGRTDLFEADLAQWRRQAQRFIDGQRVDRPVRLGSEFFVLSEMTGQGRGLSIAPRVAAQIRRGHPDVPDAVWLNLPELVADPLFVYPHRDNVNVAIDATTAKGEPIVVGIREGQVRTITPRHDRNGETGQDSIEAAIAVAVEQGGKVYTRNRTALDDLLRRVSQSGRLGRAAPNRQRRRRNITTRDDVIKSRGRIFYRFGDPRPGFVRDLDALRADLTARLEQVGIADKVALNLVDQIQAVVEGKASEADGRFVRGVIDISLSAKDALGTLNHEIVHAFREMGLISKPEWRILAKAARRDTARVAEIRERFKGLNLTEEDLIEESVADMFADWAAGRATPKGLISTAFERMRKLIRALGRVLKQRGHRTVEDIFEGIESGEIANRAPDSAPAGEKFSVVREAKDDSRKDGLFGRSFEFTSRSARQHLYDENLTLVGRLSGAAAAEIDTLRVKLQDKFLPLKRIQEAVQRARGVDRLPEGIDAYLAEELFHGKAGQQLDDFRADEVEPLIAEIDESDLTLEDVELFLFARHAPERNAQIARINPELEGRGSGMTDAEAEEVMAMFRKERLTGKLEAVAKRIDRINRRRLDVMEKAGLIDAVTKKRWQDTYEFYVPLRGFEVGDDVSDQARPRTGKGFDIRGEESKRALGRTSRPGSILAYTLSQFEEAVIRAEKNKVGQTFAKLVQANPNADIWEINEQVVVRRINKQTGLVEAVGDPLASRADNVLAVKVGGKVQNITIRHEALARAMKNLGAESMNGLERVLQVINRWLALVRTSLDPEFVISNLARDLQTAAINLQEFGVDKLGRDVMRDVPKAMRGAFRGIKGKTDTAWSKHFREFADAGGKISFFGLEDIDTKRRKLEKMLLDLNPNNVQRSKIAVRTVFNFVQDVNGAVENAVRLSTFVNLRRRGVSEKQAASIARNLTVNFNRKGEWAAATGGLFLFYNASMQGSVRMIGALGSKRVRRIVGGVTLSFMALDLINWLISPEDDDKEKKYDKISQWTKDHNLIVMNPFAGDEVSVKDAVALKVPLPYGYNVFAAMGTRASEVIRGKIDRKTGKPVTPLGAAIDTFAIALNSFNPIGSEDEILKVITPTLLKPTLELETNKNFAGSPIMPENNPYTVPRPDSQRFWSSVSEPSRVIAEQLNSLTGGSSVRPGLVDVSPETLDHWVNFVTGGAGMFVNRSSDFVIKWAQGDKIEWRNVPFARRLVEGNNVYWERSRYREIRDAALLFEKERKTLLQAGERDAAKKALERFKTDAQMLRLVKGAEKAMRKPLQMRAAVQSNTKLSREEKRDRLERVDNVLNRIRRRVLRRYNTLRETQADG